MTKNQPAILLISASDLDNDSRLQRIYKHVQNAGATTVTATYGNHNEGANNFSSPIPARSFFARLLDVAKMLFSRILSDRQLLDLLSNRLITKQLRANSFKASQEDSIGFVIVKHWTSLPIALLLEGSPEIWLDINEVFEAEHDNSRLWQLIYKPVIIRLLKLAEDRIVLRSATSLAQIDYMGDKQVLHLPNTKKPIDASSTASEKSDAIKLLYHGLITTNRSIETAIMALYKCGRSDLELTIRGHGKPRYVEKLKSLVTKLNLSPQVHFEPSVENNKLIETASHYDVGLCLFDNHSKQLMLAEPNKIYEYMAAGLGIIASDTPTMQRLVKSKNIGALTSISDQQVDLLTKLFSELSREQISIWQKNSHAQAALSWNANYDWPKLDSFLKQIQLDLSSKL